MKKESLLGLCALLLGVGLWCNPLEAKAEHYYYWETSTVSGGDTISVGKWYKGGIEAENMLEGMPENTTFEDMYSIHTAPDEECEKWLKSLTGEVGDLYVYVDSDVQIQIGTPENPLHSVNLANDGGIVTLYGDLDSYWAGYGDAKDGIHCGGTSIIYGDVGRLCVGMTGAYDFPLVLNGKVQISGDVEELVWAKTTGTVTAENTYYSGFIGDISIGGTLGGGKIQEIVYDPSIQKDTWHVTGEVGACAAGEFSMTAGVLSDNVIVTDVEPELGNYYFIYQHYHGDGVNGSWTRYGIDNNTGNIAFYESCQLEDIPDGAKVGVFGTPKALTLDIDISELTIVNSDNGYPVDVTINGDVGEFYLSIYDMASCDVTINGDVEHMTTVYRYSPECNLTVSGKIADAEYQNNRGRVQGYFTAENMQVIIDGEWNPALFMYTSKEDNAIGFVPVDNESVADALEGNNVGEEVKVSTADGEKTLVKTAEVLLQQTAETVLEQLSQKEELAASLEVLKEVLKTAAQEVKNMAPVCAVDINLNTYYADKETGERYENAAEYGTEAVTRLEQGKSLEFTVKVPEDYYDERAEYHIIRQHEDENGSVEMDVLDTVRKGDQLTFKSDRFSTFIIVKADMGEVTPAETPDPTTAPTEVPAETPAPTVAPTEAPAETPAPTVAPTTAPTTAPAPTASPKAEETVVIPKTYTVQRGDTLSLIAYKHGMSLKELIVLNPQIKNPNLIYCNQVIIVGMTQSNGDATAEEQYYTIKKGDSLYKIAKKHKMTLRELIGLNRALAQQRYIYAGQKVKIK